MFNWLRNLFRQNPPPHPETMFVCWVCQNPRPHSTGISLTDPDSIHGRVSQVCKPCWVSIPAAERIHLMRTLRPKDLGGIGIPEATAAAGQAGNEIVELLASIDGKLRGIQEEESEPDYWKRAGTDEPEPEEPRRIPDDEIIHGEQWDGPYEEPLRDVGEPLNPKPRKKRQPKCPPPNSRKWKSGELDDEQLKKLTEDDGDLFQQGTN